MARVVDAGEKEYTLIKNAIRKKYGIQDLVVGFFGQFSKKYGEDCAGYGNREENMKWMDDLKKLWRKMDSENKGKTIKYFQNLTTMSRLYYN